MSPLELILLIFLLLASILIVSLALSYPLKLGQRLLPIIILSWMMKKNKEYYYLSGTKIEDEENLRNYLRNLVGSEHLSLAAPYLHVVFIEFTHLTSQNEIQVIRKSYGDIFYVLGWRAVFYNFRHSGIDRKQRRHNYGLLVLKKDHYPIDIPIFSNPLYRNQDEDTLKDRIRCAIFQQERGS